MSKLRFSNVCVVTRVLSGCFLANFLSWFLCSCLYSPVLRSNSFLSVGNVLLYHKMNDIFYLFPSILVTWELSVLFCAEISSCFGTCILSVPVSFSFQYFLFWRQVSSLSASLQADLVWLSLSIRLLPPCGWTFLPRLTISRSVPGPMVVGLLCSLMIFDGATLALAGFIILVFIYQSSLHSLLLGVLVKFGHDYGNCNRFRFFNYGFPENIPINTVTGLRDIRFRHGLL